MSAERKQTIPDKINPYIPAQIPDSVTMEQVRQLGAMYTQQYRDMTEMYKGLANHLKDLLKDSGLKFWIIAAGLGAIVEIVRVVWLAIRFAFSF